MPCEKGRGLMAHTHCTGPGQGQGPGNDGFLYFTMYCTHYTGPGNDGFLYFTMYCTHYTGPGNDGFLYFTMYCTHYRDRDREPLFSIVPFPVSVAYSVYEP